MTPERVAANLNSRIFSLLADNDLFLMNHFLTSPVASPDLADQVNHQPLLGDRADQCMSETGDFINWIAVDFYDIGDLFEVIDDLNGL